MTANAVERVANCAKLVRAAIYDFQCSRLTAENLDALDEAIAALTQSQPTDALTARKAKWAKWPNGDAGDAVDFACDHCEPDEALTFLDDWRGSAGEDDHFRQAWPGYVRWLNAQRDAALTSISTTEEDSDAADKPRP